MGVELPFVRWGLVRKETLAIEGWRGAVAAEGFQLWCGHEVELGRSSGIGIAGGRARKHPERVDSFEGVHRFQGLRR